MAGVPYETVNILEDENLRQGMKEFSQWPTFPQVISLQAFNSDRIHRRNEYQHFYDIHVNTHACRCISIPSLLEAVTS